MKRKLLLIMPNFFDYPQAICEELENMGYEVDCFDDRPSTNGMVKAIIKYAIFAIKANCEYNLWIYSPTLIFDTLWLWGKWSGIFHFAIFEFCKHI